MQFTQLKAGNASMAVAFGRFGSQALEGVKKRVVIDIAKKFFDGGFRAIATTRDVASKEKGKPLRAPRHLTIGSGKSAGRNSAGRITSFHRGGGAKRLQRVVDVKRNTESTGVIEKIDYDPNRSAKLALVRWDTKVRPQIPRKCKTMKSFSPSEKILEPTSATALSFSSISRTANERNVTSFSQKPTATYVRVGVPTTTWLGSKSVSSSNNMGGGNNSVNDIFLSVFSSSKAKSKIRILSGSSSSIPTIAVAGPKPLYFSPQMNKGVGERTTFSLFEIQKWKGRDVWDHKLKNKESASWVNSRQKDASDLIC